jgi:antitoxin VapB
MYIQVGYTIIGLTREMTAVVRTRVFLSNKTQAVRLPKAVSLSDGVEEVEIVAVGDSRVITPVGQSWDAWFAGAGVSSDFMGERDQPAVPGRETLD